MKIEKIDDNSIRCTLTSLDLSSRNINLNNMNYGSEAAKRLFSEMMQKAQAELGFQPEGGPLMIEAIPLKGGSVQLVITRVTDPEELDARFSRFTRKDQADKGFLSQLAAEILDGAQGIMKQMKEKPEGVDSAPKEALEDTANTEKSEETKIFAFESLDVVSSAVRSVNAEYKGKNTLYKNPGNGTYYLLMTEAENGSESLLRAVNVLLEYGEKLKSNDLMKAYMDEHLEIIIKDDAIRKLKML